jgi:hypothetical protein
MKYILTFFMLVSLCYAHDYKIIDEYGRIIGYADDSDNKTVTIKDKYGNPVGKVDQSEKQWDFRFEHTQRTLIPSK